MKVLLRKVKWNKGQTENGHSYDYTRIYYEVPVYDGSPNEFGVDVVEAEYGNEAKHTELTYLKGKLPLEVELETMDVKKGNNTLKVVTLLKPVAPVTSAKA